MMVFHNLMPKVPVLSFIIIVWLMSIRLDKNVNMGMSFG